MTRSVRVPAPSLTEGPIASSLARLALPMVVAMIAMVGFNVVDTYFVGRLGTEQLAAMGFTFPVVLVISSLSVGVGIGATATISRAIGAGDSHRTQRLTTDAVTLGLVVTVVLAVAGLLTVDPLFRALGARGEVLEYVRQYMTIWYLGVPVVIIPQVGNSAIRATGDTKTPAAIMISAMLLNVVLDPLLIFGLGPVPALGLRGAALATLTTRSFALVVSLWVLARREHMLSWERPSAAEGIESWKSILFIGLPAGLTQLIVPVSQGVVTRLVADFGVAAVAGFGVATRLELFAVFTVNALGSALIPFVGQNWGAGEPDRARGAVKAARWFALGWGAVMWIVFLAAGPTIAGLFDDNPMTVATTVDYLWIVGASFGLQGLVLVNTSAFNALNRPMQSMWVSVLRMAAFYLPVAWALSSVFGLEGIWWAAAFANLATGVLSVLWFDKVLRDMTRDHHERVTLPAVEGVTG